MTQAEKVESLKAEIETLRGKEDSAEMEYLVAQEKATAAHVEAKRLLTAGSNARRTRMKLVAKLSRLEKGEDIE